MDKSLSHKLSNFFGFTKSGDDCGANAQGGGGFQPGNQCGTRKGSGGTSGGTSGAKKSGNSIPTGPRDMASRIIRNMSVAEKNAALRSNQGAVDVVGFLADKMFDDLNEEQLQRVADFVIDELNETKPAAKPAAAPEGKKLSMAEKLAKLRDQSHDESMKDAVENHNATKARRDAKSPVNDSNFEDAVAKRIEENMRKIKKTQGKKKL